MAQGLQCWDADGTIVVDIGDYNCRWVTVQNIASPTASAPSTSFGVSGCTAAGAFATVVAASSGPYDIPKFACRTFDGGVTVYLLSGSFAVNLTLAVRVYFFI